MWRAGNASCDDRCADGSVRARPGTAPADDAPRPRRRARRSRRTGAALGASRWPPAPDLMPPHRNPGAAAGGKEARSAAISIGLLLAAHVGKDMDSHRTDSSTTPHGGSMDPASNRSRPRAGAEGISACVPLAAVSALALVSPPSVRARRPPDVGPPVEAVRLAFRHAGGDVAPLETPSDAPPATPASVPPATLRTGLAGSLPPAAALAVPANDPCPAALRRYAPGDVLGGRYRLTGAPRRGQHGRRVEGAESRPEPRCRAEAHPSRLRRPRRPPRG